MLPFFAPGARPLPPLHEDQKSTAGRWEEAEHAAEGPGVEAQTPPHWYGLELAGQWGRTLVGVGGGALWDPNLAFQCLSGTKKYDTKLISNRHK